MFLGRIRSSTKNVIKLFCGRHLRGPLPIAMNPPKTITERHCRVSVTPADSQSRFHARLAAETPIEDFAAYRQAQVSRPLSVTPTALTSSRPTEGEQFLSVLSVSAGWPHRIRRRPLIGVCDYHGHATVLSVHAPSSRSLGTIVAIASCQFTSCVPGRPLPGYR